MIAFCVQLCVTGFVRQLLLYATKCQHNMLKYYGYIILLLLEPCTILKLVPLWYGLALQYGLSAVDIAMTHKSSSCLSVLLEHLVRRDNVKEVSSCSLVPVSRRQT